MCLLQAPDPDLVLLFYPVTPDHEELEIHVVSHNCTESYHILARQS